jgi:hypothetical protein
VAATPSVRIVKSFAYKDQTKLWSNRYHFNGGVPASTAAWQQLFDNITAAEKAIFHSEVTIVEALGFAAGSDVPVATKAYTLAGTLSITGLEPCPGDVAALIRYSTAARTSKNHPVYLFNYYHAAFQQAAPERDKLLAVQSTAMATYAANWISGFSDGSSSYNRAGPNGASATGSIVETYLTHRDFPR